MHSLIALCCRMQVLDQTISRRNLRYTQYGCADVDDKVRLARKTSASTSLHDTR